MFMKIDSIVVVRMSIAVCEYTYTHAFWRIKLRARTNQFKRLAALLFIIH